MDRRRGQTGRLLILFFALALPAACSDLSSHPRWAGASVAAASSFAAPGATAAIDPVIVVTSPPPGEWVAGPDIVVEGRAFFPAAPITAVAVGGLPAAVGTDGRFQATVKLAGPGLSTLTVRATDGLGVDHFAHVSYVRGPFTASTVEVPDALLARLAPSGLGPANDLAQGELQKLDFAALLRSTNPLPIQLVGNFIAVELDFVTATYLPPVTSLALGNGAIDVRAQIDSIRVDVVVHDRGSGLPLNVPATVTAKRATAIGKASLVVPAGNGPVTVSLPPPTVVLDGFDVKAQGLIPSIAGNLLESTIKKLLEKKIAEVVTKHVPRILDAELAKVTGPQRLALGQSALDLTFRPTRADVTPAGLSIAIAGDVAPVVSGGASPFSWISRGAQAPVLPGKNMVELALSRDLLSKALVAAWRAGALDHEIDGSTGTSLGGTLPLDAGSITKLVPELTGVVPASTPLVVRLRPRCPPELRLGPAPAPFVLVVGEVLVEVEAALGGSRVPLLGVTLHGEVEADVQVSQNALTIGPGPRRGRLLFTVTSQPVVRIDEGRLQTRLSILVDALLPKAFAPLSAIKVPVIFGKQLVSPEVGVPGPGFDHVVAGTGL